MERMEHNADGDSSFYFETEYWTPPNNCYPTWNDAYRFVWSRTVTQPSGPDVTRLNQRQALCELATFVHLYGMDGW